MTVRRRSPWLCVLTAALAAGCVPTEPPTAKAGPDELPTVVVTAAAVEVRAVQRTVAAVGTLNGYDEVTLAPKLDGRVTELRVDVGDVAIPGAVLLTLDATDYQLAATEARRALEAELARLGLSDLPAGAFDPDAVPSVRRAKVGWENAASRFNTRKGLYDRKALAQEEYELAETELKVAEAGYREAVTNALAVLATARLRKASVELAEQRVRDCELVTPTPPGWAAWAAAVGPGFTPLRYAVAARLVSEGEMVRSMPVTNAYRLVIDHALKLRAAVPERYTAEVRVGQPVDVRVDAYPGETFRGRVARVNPTVDPQSRTFQVEVAVPNLDGRLHCGGFARCDVRTRTDPAVKSVPPAAVVTFAGVTKVFVLAGGKAKAVPVEVGVREKGWVEVIGAVPDGATVATSGHSQLVDGSPVKLRGQ